MKDAKPLIRYSNREFTHVQLSFTRENRIKDILGVLMDMEIPLRRKEHHNWEFVVLELLTNSIRASIESQSTEKIGLVLNVRRNLLTTMVKDGAGGFDFTQLPFDPFAPVQNINVFSRSFENYRLKHKYQRYGLGIFSAKRFADEFDMFMIDHKGNKTLQFEKSEIYGTVVSFKKKF
jgi:anti-sigma regulatory factor (Ser/Thr protein kinase)